MADAQEIDAVVVGGGPAGLMAAEALLDAGRRVLLAEAKPSPGRKFLMAGKSGLNLTKDEPLEAFLSAYGSAQGWLEPMLRTFGPEQVVSWANALGQQVFTGTSGRVFPTAMKASPLLRAWLAQLGEKGLEVRRNWHWSGPVAGGAGFDTPSGAQILPARAIVLALGGASWPRLGSDGHWAALLAAQGVELAPFRPANMGFRRTWSPHMAAHFGAPVKPVRLRAGDAEVLGEMVVTSKGIEGSAVYAISAALRDACERGDNELTLDLAPDLSAEVLAQRLARPRGKATISNHLRKAAHIAGVKAALLREVGPLPATPDGLARRIKALTITVDGPLPLAEAISTAGGVPERELNPGLMLRALPGTFCAGEMLDWEAPTGGYLLTACLATGLHAGRAAARYLDGA